MITLFTGAPGTGKSAAAVSLLAELAKGRAIYASGIPDLAIDHVNLDDVTEWPSVVPDGSIIVIDEVQRVWRPRGPGTKVPADIAALETHRHRGLDFYVVTQAPRLMDANIRGLVGRHVHLRDLGILGRFWYEWPECADNCATAWRNAPIKKRYRLPKAAFSLYKSASVHIKPIRSVPWMLAVMVLALVLVAGLSWKAYAMISSKVTPAKPPASAPSHGGTIDSITQRPVAQSGSAVKVIDDRTDWTPRVANRPESAPAYDSLRVVVNMPVVTGGVCMDERCKCVTQQGTDAGLSDSDCRRLIETPQFDPYTPRQQAYAGQGSSRQLSPAPMQPVPTSVAPTGSSAPFQLPPESSADRLRRLGAVSRSG